MKRRQTWKPGWVRPVQAQAASAREPAPPGIEQWLLGPGGKAEPTPLPKRQRPTGGGPLPVRGSSEQGAARRAAAVWSKVLGGLEHNAVASLQKQASAEAAALGHLLDKEQDKARKILAKLPPDVGAEIALALAAGDESVRRARAAAIKASFELGLVKKLLRAGWLPSGPPEVHAADLASYEAAAQWWAERRERRSLRGPLMVKGAPRPFPRNN